MLTLFKAALYAGIVLQIGVTIITLSIYDSGGFAYYVYQEDDINRLLWVNIAGIVCLLTLGAMALAGRGKGEEDLPA